MAEAGTARRRPAGRGARGGAALVLALGLAACTSPGSGTSGSGSDAGGGSGAEGLPDTLRIMSIRALTGPVSFAGLNAQKGIDLAIEQIEADGLLGETTIEVDSRDSASSPQEAASFASQAIADPSYVAIIGPEASSGTTCSPSWTSVGLPLLNSTEAVVTPCCSA